MLTGEELNKAIDQVFYTQQELDETVIASFTDYGEIIESKVIEASAQAANAKAYADSVNPELLQHKAEKDQPGGYVGLDANGKIDSEWIKDASETVKGVVELATPAEVLAGEDDERAVTPAGLSDWNKTPVGTIIIYPVSSIPSHCLECNGAVISRETYPELFTAIGTTYGEGDGSTTFKIPDLRGEFIRGWDHGRGLDGTLDRAIATIEADSISKDDLTMILQRSSGGVNTAMPYVNGGNNQVPFNANGDGSLYTTITSNEAFRFAGDETRPHNVAMMYCIVYE